MDLKHYLENAIWNLEGETPPRHQAYLARLLRWIYALIREVREGGLDNRAMGLVYTTLLSLAPLLAVSFSVLKAFGVHNQLRPLLLEVLTPLGEKRIEVTATLIGFVENIQVGVLGTVGLALLFYSVIGLLEKVEASFNHIWRIAESRNWTRRFSDYLSILLIGPVLVFSALGITASMASGALVQKIIALEPFGTLYYLLGLAIPYVLSIAAFTFVYAFMPNTKVRFGAALTGGVIAGLAWKIVGWLFATLVAESASYSAIYSGFAVVILSMIWLYLSWLILLAGGVIAFYRQYPRYLRYKSRQPQLNDRQREQLGFLLMYWIGKSYHSDARPQTLTALTEAADLPWVTVSDSLLTLVKAGLLAPLHTDPESFLPAKAPETIALQDVYLALHAPAGTPLAPADPAPGVEALCSRLEQSALTVLEGLSLHDLVLGSRSETPGKPASRAAIRIGPADDDS